MNYFKTKALMLAVIVGLSALVLVSHRALGQLAESGRTITPAPTNWPALVPGPNDPRIAYVTARLMEQFQYSRRPMDADLSARFFDGYLDALDPRHDNFLQSDLAGFSIYRTNLAQLTVGGRGVADLTPAFDIYERYLERLRQHDEFALNWLARGHFKFNTDDRIDVDRRHEPFPKDLAEARKLWEQQIKFEYLQDKLTRELAGTNGAVQALTKTDLTEITNGLNKHYRANFHYFTNWDGSEVLQAYLNGLTHAYDPHSDYFNQQHAQDFSMKMSLSMFGIGAFLSDDDGYCTINQIVPGGPAAKSKQVKENDRIVAVAQGDGPSVNVVDMDINKVVELIRGPKASTVRLTISPAADRTARKVVAIVRDEVKMADQTAKARLIEIPDANHGAHRLGVIDLPSFYAPVGLSADNGSVTPRNASVDVAKLITKLKAENVEGIILDIRGNLGGSVEEVVKLTGLFIKDGPVVLARPPEGRVIVDSATETNLAYGGPLAVMIDRYSASASEIAAAALQDYDRGLIVGDTSSFGKGTMQTLENLHPFVWPAIPSATNDPGAVKITIRKYYRVSGESTQFKGVVPDIIFPDVMDHEMAVESEKKLENALPWDTISAVPHARFNMVQPCLPALSQKSAARVATNQEFAYIQQDIKDLEKQDGGRSLTLNEREAIRERQTNAEKQKARTAERDARKPANLKIYDIGLAEAAQPGLPNPSYYPGMVDTNFPTISTIALQPASPGARYTANDQALARSVGLDLATGALTNHSIAVNATVSITNSTATITKFLKLKQPDLDPLLRETTDIMTDYISLLAPNASLTKT